ncbi:MAG: alpha/beta hydrolase family esterase [Muribaculaceae bacterium]
MKSALQYLAAATLACVAGTIVFAGNTGAAAPGSAAGDTATKKTYEVYTFPYGDTVRTYSMYIPDSLAPGRPLIVMTHGYNSKTRRRKDLNKQARKYGFAICYPNGSPDSKGKEGWDVGYPAQYTMTVNEAEWFGAFVPKVAEKFNLSPENVFLAGMSNGGDLCYQIMYEKPEVFKAYASVAGLTFECVYDSLRLTAPKPFLEIHGNNDRTSAWQGDHLNKGGWGAYIPVPLAVSAVAANNRCRSMVCDTLTSLTRPEAKVYHTLYTDSPYGTDVEVYEIDGGKHSWGHKDVPTAEIILRFFNRYVK